MKTKLMITAILLFGIKLTSQAQDDDLKTRSLKYVKAYFNEDGETCAQYLHDSVTWGDPTYSEIAPNNKPVTGKAELLAHMIAMGEEISDLDYTIEHHFVSANYAIFEGIMSYSWTDQSINKKYDFSIREVTVLEFKDGKVYKHTDHSDFKTWREQYKTQAPKSE